MSSSSPSSEDDAQQQQIQALLANMSTTVDSPGVGQPPLPSGGEFSRARFVVSSPFISGVVPTGASLPGGNSVPSVATPAMTRSVAAAVPAAPTTLPTFSTPVGGGSSAPPADKKPSFVSNSPAVKPLPSEDGNLFGLFYFDGNLDGICCGVVAGGQICCSLPTLCNFKHRKKPKVAPKAGYYAKSHNANGAFFGKPFLPEPNAAASQSFQRFVTSGTLLPLYRWSAVFKAVTEGTLDDSQVADVVEDAEEDVKQLTPATPSLKKPRLADLQGDEETGGGGWPLLTEYMKALWKRMSVLEGQLGLDQGSSSFGTWGAAVEEANDKCSELEEQLRDLHEVQMIQLRNEVNVVSASATTAYQIAIQLQQNGVDVSRTVAEVKRIFEPKFTAMDQDRARITTLESTVADLTRKLTETNRLVLFLANQSGGNVRLPQPGPQIPSPVDFKKLQTRVQDLEKGKKGSGLTYSVEGKRFSSEEDARVWAAQHMPSSMCFEVFQGLMSLMCSATDDVGYSSSVVTEQLHAHKTGFNDKQVNVVASHKGPYPPSLAGKNKATPASASVLVESGYDDTKKRVAQDPSPFKEIPTYQAWNAGDEQTGVRFTLLEHLNNVKEELSAHITTTLVGHEHAEELCQALLSTAWNDLEWLANQIDSFHQRLISTVCSDKDSCPPAMRKMIWNVVTSSLKAFFDELRTVRVKASSAHNQSDNHKRNGLYLWATLQELALISEFKKTGFQRHEKIYHRIVMHILDTYASKTAVKTMVGSETSVTASINGLNTRMTAVEKRSVENGTKVGNVAKDVKKLKENS